jgi:DNA-3-methyladenine glycosylase II
MDAARYAAAETFLAGLDADWAQHLQRVGPCRLECHLQREPYEALVRSVAFQQLHGRAAEAILGRLLALFPGQDFPTPEQLLALPVDVMRGCGFSARKIETLQGIATASLAGRVPDRQTALAMDDEALIEQLVTLRGVGRWTVEMLLIFTLGRMDILPVDDFGVREGYRRLKGLELQPNRRQMAEFGLQLAPHRSVAAWYLWRVMDS